MVKTLSGARVTATAGMLSAVGILLGFFKIPITSFIELRFSFLPIALAGYLFGPWVGGAVGAVSDIGGYLVKPTGPFFPGFTLSSLLTGVIFGLCLRPSARQSAFLYRIEVADAAKNRNRLVGRIARAVFSLTGRMFFAEVGITLFVGIFLNSLWLSLLYSSAFGTVLSLARVVKELAMIPVNTLLLRVVLQPFASLYPSDLEPRGQEDSL